MPLTSVSASQGTTLLLELELPVHSRRMRPFLRSPCESRPWWRCLCRCRGEDIRGTMRSKTGRNRYGHPAGAYAIRAFDSDAWTTYITRASRGTRAVFVSSVLASTSTRSPQRWTKLCCSPPPVVAVAQRGESAHKHRHSSCD